MPKKVLIISIIILVILALVGFGYWSYSSQTTSSTQTGEPVKLFGFIPIDRGGTKVIDQTTNNNPITTETSTSSAQQTVVTKSAIPALRLLSGTPVGGYGASTTGTTTVVRWVDRGRGNIYEARENSLDVVTLSNTLLPRVYESVWGKGLLSFVGSTLQDDSETPIYIYAEMKSRATTTKATSTKLTATTSAMVTSATSTDQTIFDLRGKNLPTDTLGYAISPKKDKIFFLVKDVNGAIGYTANFDGSKAAQLFTTPLTQLTVEWPTENIIAITNKGTADRPGYLYFVNAKTGIWTKVLGPLNGLGTKVSRDGKNIFLSASVSGNIVSGIFNIASSSATDVVIHTLADKCVWGNFYKEMVYCAVPFQNFPGTYPDDWYKGTVSTIDKIWQINSITGETKLIGQLIGQAGRVIDAFNLDLDDKDNYLFFMNKNDLSLWSLDLVRSN